MGEPVASLKLQYVNEYRDRHGKLRRYFRRGAARGLLPGEIGSREFMAAYQNYLNGAAEPLPAASLAKPEGSLGAMITEFYGSRQFRDLKASSRKTYRRVLEPLARAHGHRTAQITHLEAAKVIAKIGEDRPSMANLTKAVMQNLMKYAIKAGRRQDNPFIGIDLFKTGTHHTWTEGELLTFEQRWPLGTRQRLAYALLLYTAQRVGDVAKMKRSDIIASELHVIQEKTGAELHLPVVQELEFAMRAYPAKGITLIGHQNGRPMTARSLSEFLASAIDAADLPAKCVPHGLRKAAMRRLAENGRTEKQIAAVSGHKTLREVERYTAAADQRRLAQDALRGKWRT